MHGIGNSFSDLPLEILELIFKSLRHDDRSLHRWSQTSKKIQAIIQEKKQEFFSPQALKIHRTYHNILALFGSLDAYHKIPEYDYRVSTGYVPFDTIIYNYYRQKVKANEYLKIYDRPLLDSDDEQTCYIKEYYFTICLGDENAVQCVQKHIIGSSRCIPLFDSSCIVM